MVGYAARYLIRMKIATVEPEEIVHIIWLQTGCDSIPNYFNRRVIDALRLIDNLRLKNRPEFIQLTRQDVSYINHFPFEAKRDLEVLMRVLTPSERKVINKLLEDMLQREIGESLGIAEQTINRIIKRAVNRMRYQDSALNIIYKK